MFEVISRGALEMVERETSDVRINSRIVDDFYPSLSV